MIKKPTKNKYYNQTDGVNKKQEDSIVSFELDFNVDELDALDTATTFLQQDASTLVCNSIDFYLDHIHKQIANLPSQEDLDVVISDEARDAAI